MSQPPQDRPEFLPPGQSPHPQAGPRERAGDGWQPAAQGPVEGGATPPPDAWRQPVAPRHPPFTWQVLVQGDYWSAILLQKVADTPADPADVTLQAARNWAQLRNTEWEGDYSRVPEPTLEPFTFDDGVEQSLATVSFVPMYSDEYSCNTPAIRFSVASRVDGAGLYSIVAISHIGDPGSLPQASERQILATLAPPR